MTNFREEVSSRIHENRKNADLVASAKAFVQESTAPKYCYNFAFLGRPIIQYPQDIVAMQEIIWNTQPDLIIETGIAHGGSLIFYAAMLELNAACGGNPDAYVVGVDIDIREHNRVEIEKHPMFKRIKMFEGSSVDKEIVTQIEALAAGKKSVLVCLDSMHSHQHVLEELKAYAHLATVGNYCVVFDTIIEDLPAEQYPDRPWTVGDNAKTAVFEWMKSNNNFEIDKEIENKLLITVCPDGFLKRVS